MKMLLLTLLLPAVIFAQRSASDLQPGHAAALQRYLAANQNLTFRKENDLPDDYLKSVRKWFRPSFKPNYAVGDFNRDRVKDFAVLLHRPGKCVTVTGITSEQHKKDCPLRLLVFNGKAKGFRAAFTQDLMGPAAAFINFDKKLYYGVFESDADIFFLTSARNGYRVQYPKVH